MDYFFNFCQRDLPVFPSLLCYLTSEIKASRFEYVPLCFPYLFAGVLRRRVTRSVGGFVLKRRHFISFQREREKRQKSACVCEGERAPNAALLLSLIRNSVIKTSPHPPTLTLSFFSFLFPFYIYIYPCRYRRKGWGLCTCSHC